MSEYTTRQILDMIEANGGAWGLDLSGKDLRRIDLSHDAIQAELARVREVDPEAEPTWVSERTSGIDLIGANLRETYLMAARLQGASLDYGKFQGADLTGARLQGAGLAWARLEGASLLGAHLQEAHLEYANLQEARLQGAEIETSKLQHTDLRRAYLMGARLWDADLAGANLEGAHLICTDLSATSGLDTSRLDGAIADADTRWPVGFQVPDTVVSGAHLIHAREIRSRGELTRPGTGRVATEGMTTHKTRIISVSNEKGGTGKSTSAVNLAAGLAREGQQVLLIDLDSQASATLALGLDPAPATTRLLLAGDPLPSLVLPARHNLDVLRSDDTLADVRHWLTMRSSGDARAALHSLSQALGDYLARYDFVLIDCAPGLGILGLNVLMAATDILIPVSVDYLSAVGTRQHLEMLDELRRVGAQARVSWVVPTFFDARLIRAREMIQLLKDAFGELVTSPIRTNTRLAEAPHRGLTIFEYDSRALGAEDYAALTRRVLDDTQT